MDGYNDLATLLKKCQCTVLRMLECDLTAAKLLRLHQGCSEIGVQVGILKHYGRGCDKYITLSQLVGIEVRDDFMDHEGQAAFASLVCGMKCSFVVLANTKMLNILYREWKERRYMVRKRYDKTKFMLPMFDFT